MKLNKKIIVSFILCFICSISFSLAHGGRTDSRGGHMDNSTGTYHYHHGYPAHYHYNGECEYINKNNSFKKIENQHKKNVVNGGDIIIGALLALVTFFPSYSMCKSIYTDLKNNQHAKKRLNINYYTNVNKSEFIKNNLTIYKNKYIQMTEQEEPLIEDYNLSKLDYFVLENDGSVFSITYIIGALLTTIAVSYLMAITYKFSLLLPVYTMLILSWYLFVYNMLLFYLVYPLIVIPLEWISSIICKKFFIHKIAFANDFTRDRNIYEKEIYRRISNTGAKFKYKV